MSIPRGMGGKDKGGGPPAARMQDESAHFEGGASARAEGQP